MNTQNKENLQSNDNLETSEAGASGLLSSILWGMLAISAGLLLSALILPAWLPGLMNSISGTEPKVFWFLSRATAITAFMVLWFSMAWGLLLSGRLAQLWPGTPIANDLHQFTSWLGLGFGLLHGLLLMGDRYIHFSLLQVLLPFSTDNYRPLWVGLGQLTFYLWLVIILSFYIRKRIGPKVWRGIHYASFVAFIFALFHGLFSGSDSTALWMQAMYWGSAVSLLFLTFFRIIYIREQKQQRQVSAVQTPGSRA